MVCVFLLFDPVPFYRSFVSILRPVTSHPKTSDHWQGRTIDGRKRTWFGMDRQSWVPRTTVRRKTAVRERLGSVPVSVYGPYRVRLVTEWVVLSPGTPSRKDRPDSVHPPSVRP